MSDEDGGGSSRPKRKIKKIMVLSSSDSDTDDSVGPIQTRKKKLKVISDEEASDSSGSSVVRIGVRRKGTLPKLCDSDGDSDTSGWATDHSDAPKPTPIPSKPTSGFASDSSEGNSDKCSICLMRFTDQEVGIPESCEHIFCLDCITEWSKNMNTCPVDRMTFNSITVQTHAGGDILRSEPVKVAERRSSVDLLVIEDPTVCEICRSAENEESMLLCDGCDLGYHMQCLTPPLEQIPVNQWFCPNCDSRNVQDFDDLIYLSEVDDLFSQMVGIHVPHHRYTTPIRETRLLRSSHQQFNPNEPSTSSGHRRHNLHINQEPTTRRGSRVSSSYSSRNKISRRKTTRRRKTRTKTVIIEYEVKENGKFPVSKRIKRKIKKRKIRKRQPRTVARRSHVRASVRAKLANLSSTRQETRRQEITVRGQHVGIPSLNLFGDPHELDYFSEEEHETSEGATTAVAVRPTSSMFSAYRQARRKMITIPSPPHACSAPDVLSSILESQTLLHSQNSSVSISVDGQVNITVKSKERNSLFKNESTETKKNKVDLSNGEDAAKKVPSYPGQSRGGGWGGGYRGNYNRDQGSNNYNRGNYDNNYGGGYSNRQGNLYNQDNNMRWEDSDTYGNFPRRPHQYPHSDETHFDRPRRQPPVENRGLNFNHSQRFNDQNRHSIGQSWQNYSSGTAGSRSELPHVQNRHSFGGFENPLDMRVGQLPINNNNPVESFSNSNTFQVEKPQHAPMQSYQPLPEPPVFKFDKIPDIEKSEDEKSDSGLVIDTDKYDPTEPTNDDDSGDEQKVISSPVQSESVSPSLPTPSEVNENDVIADIDTSPINVPSNILDNAVRQVLQEHRNLIIPPSIQTPNDKSDDDSDGDCPNFSIYSATSVHIANNTANLTSAILKESIKDNLEDLVQEDDEVPVETASSSATVSIKPATSDKNDEAASDKNDNSTEEIIGINKPSYNSALKKNDEDYKEKISKRCPITTSTRNPIKIKLHTPSLIKRQITLYDEEDINEDIEKPHNVEKSAQDKPEHHPKKPERNPCESPNSESNENNVDVSIKSNGTPERSHVDIAHEDLEEEKNAAIEADLSNQTLINKSPEKLVDEDLFVSEDKRKNELEINDDSFISNKNEKSEVNMHSDDENDDLENELELGSQYSKKDYTDTPVDNLEKMTESISETEDERSYTPCLDENKSKDTSLETDKEKGIEGLDTEMISEEEGNDMFSDDEKVNSEPSVTSPPRPIIGDGEEGEILDKQMEKKIEQRDEGKKKKKKESKKDGKDKNKSKNKKSEIAFKKLSKSGKERNYREREKDEKSKSKKERRDSSDAAEQKQRRKEKRKDLERYDVRTVVSEKRKKIKDAFGRDVSPGPRSRSRSPPELSPQRARRSITRERRSPSVRRSRSRVRRSISRENRTTLRARRTTSRTRRRLSSSPSSRAVSPPLIRRQRLSLTPRSISPRAISPRRSPDPKRRTSPRKRRRTASPRRRSTSRARRISPRRRQSISRGKRRRSISASPKPKTGKKKKRSRSIRPDSRARRRDSPRRKSPKRKKERRRTVSRSARASPLPQPATGWSPLSMDSRLLSPCTPPPELSPTRAHLAAINGDKRRRKEKRRRRTSERPRHKRMRDTSGPSKEVFTSGDNILVSVSFKDQDRINNTTDTTEKRKRKTESKREKRKRRKRAGAINDTETPKPVAIIDLERSPFRELTPSPKNVIVLSDSDPGDKVDEERPPTDVVEPTPEPQFAVVGGPKTPPEPNAPVKFTIATKPAPPPRVPNPLEDTRNTVTEREETRGPNTPPDPPSSPDAYDPFEPTRSASASPAAPSPERPSMTLEAAQKTNLSADEVLDRRPLSPMEKVMALLQSTRDVSPDPPPPPAAPQPPPTSTVLPPPAPTPQPSAPPVRIVLPSPTRSQPPKLFLAKPSPIKSNPIKPMQATKISKLPLPARRTRESDIEGGDSPYSPGSSDFGDLFEPPPGSNKAAKRDIFDSLFASKPIRSRKSSVAKVPVKLNRKKGKTQVGVKIDENNLKILDDLPSSAVEMQVKSKFLKKLNRQERVVEEVKLVLKPHYNKKHVTKDEYKDILRRAVPKICHNKTGEINPTKIQALVEAYVKKCRKKHKLGLV